jgi:hypothetical protein
MDAARRIGFTQNTLEFSLPPAGHETLIET